MAAPPVTEAQVATILAQRTWIDDPVQWVTKSNQAWCEATLRVKHERRDVVLQVRITMNLLAPEKASISLLLNSAHRIRAVDLHGSHTNTHTDDNQWRHETHEHCWSDRCRESWARPCSEYTDDLRNAFLVFCKQIGIAFDGAWSDPPPLQLGLSDL